ncbi:MAG: sugar ABC transporter substrate-binding protein, partial [Rhizobiaceae bacterium]|nr:sugar ABC transporter substrate-binding protein [Rhizobiaceae bacterium]
MKSAVWKSALLGGMSLLALAAQAAAGEVRVTVAEYSNKTGPYFAEIEKSFEAANPGIDVQIEVVPWDVLLQKLTT